MLDSAEQMKQQLPNECQALRIAHLKPMSAPSWTCRDFLDSPFSFFSSFSLLPSTQRADPGMAARLHRRDSASRVWQEGDLVETIQLHERARQLLVDGCWLGRLGGHLPE